MAKQPLVNTLQTLFQHLLEEERTLIDRAALIPAYEGMVPGLLILAVSMPGKKAHFEKIEYLTHILHKYVSPEERKSITGVQVFDSPGEFDDYIKYGYMSSNEESLPLHRFYVKPELIPVTA